MPALYLRSAAHPASILSSSHQENKSFKIGSTFYYSVYSAAWSIYLMESRCGPSCSKLNWLPNIVIVHSESTVLNRLDILENNIPGLSLSLSLLSALHLIYSLGPIFNFILIHFYCPFSAANRPTVCALLSRTPRFVRLPNNVLVYWLPIRIMCAVGRFG